MLYKSLHSIIKSSLLKDTAIYSFSNMLNALVPFLLIPVLTRYLSPHDYGLTAMYSALVALVSPFISFNIHGAIERQYFNQETVDIWNYIGNCILILILSTTIVSAVFLVFGTEVSSITSFPISMLWVVIATSCTHFLFNILLSLWRLKKRPLLFAIFNLSITLLNAILSIIFVILMRWGWTGRIYGQVYSYILSALVAVYILIKNKWISISFNKQYVFNALKFGIPLIPHALAGSIISMTDRLFIANMVGLGDTGLYTVGYQIGSLINLFTTAFNLAYVPWLYTKLKENNYSTKVKIVKFTFGYNIIIILIAVILGILAPIILGIFTGEAFNASSKYVIWIALGYAFNGMYLMFVNYIFYSEKTYLLAVVTFLTAILNIILNYYFIISFGAIGAAFATTIIYFIKFVLVCYLSTRVYSMPWGIVLRNRQT